MKNHIILFVAVCLTLFVSCKNNENGFTISGVVETPEEVSSVQLLKLDSTQFQLVDTATVDGKGKFKFESSSPYANIYRLKIGDNNYDLIVGNGDEVEFKTSYKQGSPDFEVKGSREEDELKEFMKISNFYSKKNMDLSNEYQQKSSAPGVSADSLLKVYRPLFIQNLRDYGKEAVNFIDKNADKLTGFYAALSIDPRENEQALIAYAEKAKDKFPENTLLQGYARQMIAVKPVSVGQKAQDFTLPGLDGKSISLSDYKGKYVMLDFWASWCGPCRAENPNIVKQYAIYKSKGLNILGISLDEDQAKWRQAISADKLTWSHASNLKGFEGPVERIYQISAIPSNFIINPEGVIIAKNITGPALEEFLKKTFSKSE